MAIRDRRRGKHLKRKRDLIKSKGKCEWCGSTENLTLDHRIPRCLGGGSWADGNWQVLCNKCNNQIKSAQENNLYTQLMMCYAPHIYQKLHHNTLAMLTTERLQELYIELNMHLNVNVQMHKKSTNRKKKSLLAITNELTKRGILNAT